MPAPHVTPPARLRVAGVGKTFRSTTGRAVRALHDIELDVAAGEIVAIVGASGCGKSTLLRIVAGLERHDEGTLLVGDQPVAGPGPDRGMLFQEHRLLPWLTVAQNIEFSLNHADSELIRRTVAEQIALVGLAGFEHAYPHQLSGGMAQRAALARSLAPSPGVLLLDEPFAALDAFTKMQLQEELLRVRRAWRPTLLIVTHDVEEAVFLADRIVVMSERPGTVRQVVDVPLSHPRDRTAEAFLRLRNTVLEHLFARGIGAVGSGSRAAPAPVVTPPPFTGTLVPRESS